MAVPTVQIGRGVTQPPTQDSDFDQVDHAGAVGIDPTLAQWNVVSEEPAITPQSMGAGGWDVVNEAPASPQGAGPANDPWSIVSEEPVRGGPSVGAGADIQPPAPAPLDPVQKAGQESKQFFGREFDLAPSSGLVMRPDDRSWAEKFRGIIPDPFRIPQRTAERFNEGVQTMQQPGALPKVLGGVQAAFSPISGASDALVRDPVLNATGDLKKANDAKMLAEIATPGIGMSLRNLGPAMAGRTLRDAPEIAAQARLPPPPAGTLPPLEPPVNPLSTRVISQAEPVEVGTQVGGAGGGGKPPIDRNASPGEFVEPPQRPLSPDEKEVLGSIGKRPGALAKAGAKAKDMLAHPQETADAAVSQVIDNLHAFRVADRSLEDVRQVGEPTIHELARLTRGAPGGAQHAIKYGTYDFNTGAQNGPGLAEITKGVNADGLRAYMLSRRTLELANRGIKSGVDVNAAQKVVQQGGGYYEKVFRDVVDFQDRVLNYYKDAGFVSDKGYAAMKHLNQEYVPLQKVVDEISNSGTGKNLNVRQIINKIKGSDEYKNVDPLKSIVDNTYTMITLAERNRALSTFVDRVERLQGGIPNLARKARTNQPLLTGPSGEGEVAANASFIRGKAFHPSDDTITVWQGGRPQYYKVDPKIAAAAKGLGEAELGTLTKLLGTAARGIRHGATSDPFYMISNLIVDQVAAAAQSKTGYKPFLSWLSGAKSMATRDQAYKDWLKTGGSQSVRYSSEYDPARRDLNMISNNQNALQRAKGAARHPIEGLTAAKEVVENATKVGEFKRITAQVEKLRKQLEKEGDASASIGTDIDAKRRAAYQSRIVTQDFQSRGANPQLQQLNAITAFMNGNIQGNVRELENIGLSGRKQAANAMKVFGAMIALPSIYTWVANHGDPRYDNAPQYEKDRYWLWLPKDPAADAVKIRKPFLPGTVIGSGIERTLDKFVAGKPDAFKGFAGAVGAAVTPPFMPNIVQPILDQYANKNSFTGAPVIPERDRRLDAPLQKGPGTSEVAKQLGEKMNLSPRIIDHYIQGYGATIGSQGVHALDSLLRPSDAPAKPDTTWKESPFLRRFFSRQPGRQPITDFYDNFRKYDELKQSAARLNKQGLPEEAKKYLDKIGENMDSFYKMMNGFSSQIRGIEDNRTMDAARKRAEILSITRDMIELAKTGNAVYRIGEQQVRERNP